MRNIKVMGACSIDIAPRRHMLNIALLSAETCNWNVFIRAHLDIMNDRISRAIDITSHDSDRDTYIKELEELGIDVIKLILGTTFRIKNPAQNHYYGTIYRLGRALAEIENPDKLEKQLLEIISDKTLDDQNRLIFYLLFINYNHFLKDDNRQKENEQKLFDVIDTLPRHYRESLRKIKL